jgi:hypothetical protein
MKEIKKFSAIEPGPSAALFGVLAALAGAVLIIVTAVVKG